MSVKLTADDKPVRIALEVVPGASRDCVTDGRWAEVRVRVDASCR